MSGITLKRAARVSRIALRPRSVRPTGSGPRASQNVASSVKNDAMRSTSRLLKASEIAFISSGVAISLLVAVVTSGIGPPPSSLSRRLQARPMPATKKARPVIRQGGLESRRTKRRAVSRLLLRNVALLVHDHLDLGVAAQGAAVPQAIRPQCETLDILVAVSLDALLCDRGAACPLFGGIGGVGAVRRRSLASARGTLARG